MHTMELMRHSKVPTKSELQKGLNILEVQV